MAQARKPKKQPEHPAVVAARRNRALMAAVRQSVADIKAGEQGTPRRIVEEELRQRRERLQP